MLDPRLIEQIASALGTESGLVEKEWHVVRAIGVLASMDHGDVRPAFSGGTSLSVGWGLIKRFSEDIDFKIALPEAANASQTRAQCRTYREKVLAALATADFKLIGEPVSRNGSKFFAADFAYPNLASHAYERQNGTGYFRSVADEAITVPQRTLATAVAWTALCSSRPWRGPFSKDDASALLRDEALQGRFDPLIVDAVLAAANGQQLKPPAKAATVLTDRETEVLARISQGESNKEVAHSLGVSPSTVRTHVESIFRKLECSTRAAATLKAYTLGII